MKSSKRFYFIYILLCLVFLQINIVCQSSTPTPESSSAVVPTVSPIAEENLIHPGDLIDVDIVGVVDDINGAKFDWRGTLDPAGFLSNNNYSENPIYALCQTEEAVAEKIAESFRKILRDPKVIVKILDRSNRPTAVLYGAVKKNQRFQIKRPVLLNELIIISGGFTEQVSGEIQIYRPANVNCSNKNSAATETNGESAVKNNSGESEANRYINIKISELLAGNSKSNPPILSGDVITVSEAKPVYITGGVVAPKQIAMRPDLTVSRAIDSAGGLAQDADASAVRIFRRNGIETKSIVANLNKIKAGQAEDIGLQPFDVIDVPQAGRQQRNFPPVIREFIPSEKQTARLPLKIID